MPRWFLHIVLPPIVLLVIVTGNVSAQVDDINQPDTTITIENQAEPIVSGNVDTAIVEEDEGHSPRRAALFSAVLPGLGQAYNKKYWKIPIIYGGAAILIYYINNYNDNYTLYLRNLKAERDSDPETINNTGFNDRNLERRVDFYRRNRDYMIIVTGFLYLLNIADAHVDAHLQGFNIGEVVKVEPSVEYTAFNSSVTGLSLSILLGK